MFLASPWQDEDVTICHHASYSVTGVALLGGENGFPMSWEIHVQQWEEGKAHLKDAFSIVWGSYFFAWACKIKIHWVVMIVTAVTKCLF